MNHYKMKLCWSWNHI